MGFRFRRRIKLFPGVSINLSKSGISTTVGVQGLHETFGNGKVRTTVGLPGSGLSYTTVKGTKPNSPGTPRASTSWLVWLLVAVMVGSVVIALTT